MGSLGWKIGEWKAEFKVSAMKLSEEEEKLVLSVAERFRDQTQKREISDEGQANALIGKSLERECDEEGIELDSDQKEYIAKSVFMQTFGMGFLEELISDQTLEEIAVIGLEKPIYVYVRGKGWKRTNVAIDSLDYFISLVNRMGRGLGRRLTSQQPRMNAVLDDGSRLHASMPPISGCELTIRKFGKEPLSAFDLLSFGTFDAKTLALLSLAMQADLSIMVAGNTASGKTTTLNALLSFIPASERLLLIEETPEIATPHPHQVRLLPFEEIGMTELVRDSLRMRPDRVVVGETRGAGEARAFLESALSGQAKGCYTTFHAQTFRDALLRMRMMGCMEADLGGIDLCIVQRRVSTYETGKKKVGERRKVTEISISNEKEIFSPIIAYDGKKYSGRALSLLLGKISEATELSVQEVGKEAAQRSAFLQKKGKTRGFEKCFSAIQGEFFGI